MDQLYQYILSYDIDGLRDFWDYLNDRFFKRLDYQHNSNVKKLEMCLLRLYVVHAVQNSKNDKVVEFFEKYTAELQTQLEWREWFGKFVVSVLLHHLNWNLSICELLAKWIQHFLSTMLKAFMGILFGDDE